MRLLCLLFFLMGLTVAAQDSVVAADTGEGVPLTPIPVFTVDTIPALAHVRDTCWYGMCAVNAFENGGQFYIGMLTNDTDVVLSLAIPADSPFDTPGTWQWCDTRRCYLPTPSEEMSVRIFLVSDPLAEVNFTDVWTWYARRSTSAGYADDGHALPTTPRTAETALYNLILPDSAIRPDGGAPAWQSRYYGRRITPRVQRFFPAVPTESMADVAVAARWEEGFWTIEFKRKRRTSNPDDLPLIFDEPVRFQFVVRYPDGRALQSSLLVIPAADQGDDEFVPLTETEAALEVEITPETEGGNP